MVMKLTINVPSDAIAAIKEEIKDQGYEPPTDSELQEALEFELEEGYSYEILAESELRFSKAEWIINNYDLKKIVKEEK